MKRKITRIRPDGSKEITEIDDEAPAMRKNELAVKMQGEPPAKQYLNKVATQGQRGGMQGNQNLAAQGQRGDTQLAHVNPWEAILLERLGGAGTRNPQTGLKQFYTDYTATPQQYQDYLSYFNTAKPGDVLPNWAGGSLTMGTGGQATYTNPNESYTFGANTPLSEVYAKSPGIASQWDIQYGNNPNSSDFFNFPLDIMPTNTSSSSSYSGLPAQYRDQLLAGLMPQLQDAILNMPGNIDQYTQQALGSYQQMMQNALRTNLPRAIGGLANRGILQSTEGNKILSDVFSNAAMDASNKGYTTAMQTALLKANMPSVLAQIGELGRSTGTASSGYQEDPTAMYSIMADMIRAMMT